PRPLEPGRKTREDAPGCAPRFPDCRGGLAAGRTDQRESRSDAGKAPELSVALLLRFLAEPGRSQCNPVGAFLEASADWSHRNCGSLGHDPCVFEGSEIFGPEVRIATPFAGGARGAGALLCGRRSPPFPSTLACAEPRKSRRLVRALSRGRTAKSPTADHDDIGRSG